MSKRTGAKGSTIGNDWHPVEPIITDEALRKDEVNNPEDLEIQEPIVVSSNSFLFRYRYVILSVIVLLVVSIILYVYLTRKKEPETLVKEKLALVKPALDGINRDELAKLREMRRKEREEESEKNHTIDIFNGEESDEDAGEPTDEAATEPATGLTSKPATGLTSKPATGLTSKPATVPTDKPNDPAQNRVSFKQPLEAPPSNPAHYEGVTANQLRNMPSKATKPNNSVLLENIEVRSESGAVKSQVVQPAVQSTVQPAVQPTVQSAVQPTVQPVHDEMDDLIDSLSDS